MHIIFVYIYLTTLSGTPDYRLLNDYTIVKNQLQTMWEKDVVA